PHATGIVMAQMPTPRRKSQVSATSRMPTMPPASVKPNHQPSGVWLVSTIRDTFSVTDLKVCPGAMTRNSSVTGSTIGLLTGASFVAIVSLPSPSDSLAACYWPRAACPISGRLCQRRDSGLARVLVQRLRQVLVDVQHT